MSVVRRIRPLPTLEESLADDPLRDFHVWWLNVSARDAANLQRCLNAAKREEDIQSYLAKRPITLVLHLGGGHGRYVIPKQRRGAEHVTDFMIAECHSGGFEWQAVELEYPAGRMFTKNGDPTKELSHAIRQIQDWRTWLRLNQNYAARSRLESGLGLPEIMPNLPGLILIGRRATFDDKNKERRRQMEGDLNIRIHTYDFLVENAQSLGQGI